MFRELDQVRVKGKDEAVGIYEPVCRVGEESQATRDELMLYAEALKLYRARNWDRAEVQFLNLQKLHPERYLYKMYAERMAHFREDPPGEGWDGAFTFKTKCERNGMKVRVLGCSGGIGGNLRTTSMLVDDDILIDAGTGVADLSLDELMLIDHVFVTHSHLDHIVCIPFLVDTVIGMRRKHITVHAARETWQTLKHHIFNWKIWPDFSTIPDEADPFLRYSEIRLGETVALNGRRITPLPASHTVPAVGFQLDGGAASLVFTGDTGNCDALWRVVNAIDNLKYLIIETAYSNGERELARRSRHLCPSLLRDELKKLRRPVEVYITHLKPGEGDEIMRQVGSDALEFDPMAVSNQQVFTL